jgi:hypothetical protein
MVDFPFVLGNNAAGFPHVFAGTSRPHRFWAGAISARVLWGRLDQSRFSPVDTGEARRFASGLVLVLQPRGVKGLELGAARFFHLRWPEGGLTKDHFAQPFATFLKNRIRTVLAPVPGDSNQDADNQLASLFARWSPPRSGFEIYAEYGKEDHNWDARDYLVELDHASTFGLGLRRAWQSSSSLMAFRGEVFGAEASTLRRHRVQGAYYLHARTPQGHTHLGQLLGAGIAVGTHSGATIALDRFNASGSWTLSIQRLVVGQRMTSDVQYAARFDHSVRMRPDVGAKAGLTFVRELNRHFSGDKSNVRLDLAVAWFPTVKSTVPPWREVSAPPRPPPRPDLP